MTESKTSPKAFLPTTRRQFMVLSGAAIAVPASPGALTTLPKTLAAVTEMVPEMLAEPRIALILWMGLREKLRRVKLPSGLTDIAIYGDPKVEVKTFDKAGERRVARIRAQPPHPMQQELGALAFHTDGYFGGNQPLNAVSALRDWSQNNNEKSFHQLLRLTALYDDSRHWLSHEPTKLEEHLDHSLQSYREVYTQIRAIEAALKQEPKLFAKALGELAEGLPKIFTKTGETSVDGWLQEISKAQSATLELQSPDELESAVWRQFSRLTGTIPKAAGQELQEVLQQQLKKTHTPYLSPKAEQIRERSRIRKQVKKYDVQLTRTQEERPIYAPGYEQPLGAHTAIVYRAAPKKEKERHAPANWTLMAMRDHINEAYTFDPRITQEVRFGETQRATHDKDEARLTIINPPPKLEAWLKKLNRPLPRIDAAEAQMARIQDSDKIQHKG